MKIDFEENREELEIGDMFKDKNGEVYFVMYNGSSEELPIETVLMNEGIVDGRFKSIDDVISEHNGYIVKIIKNKDILITNNNLK